MKVSERAFNWCIGLSVLSWALLGLTATGEEALTSPVRWGIAALNVVVGLLFIARKPVCRHGGVIDIAMALPALIIAGLALRWAPSADAWSAGSQAVFLFGVVLTIVSLLRLGRNFSVLPARRGVVTAGPYRLVRHPVYLGELIMLLGCAVAGGGWLGYALVLLALVLMVVRCRTEERVLAFDPEYQAYRERTPDMILPGTSWMMRLFGGRRQSKRALAPIAP